MIFEQVDTNEPVKGPVPSDHLIPDEWKRVVKALLPKWKVEINIIDAPGLNVNGRAWWLRGNSAEIQMDYSSFLDRSLEEGFGTFLHEIAHVKLTVGQSSRHVHQTFLKMIPDDELAEVLKDRSDDPTFPSEYIANKQRDLWLEAAEAIVGKDADWREKAKVLINGEALRNKQGQPASSCTRSVGTHS